MSGSLVVTALGIVIFVKARVADLGFRFGGTIQGFRKLTEMPFRAEIATCV